MTSGRIFWGTLFIVCGGALLLSMFGIYLPFGNMFRLWPLLLIILGVSIFLKNRPLRGIFFGLVAAAVAICIVGAVHEGWEFNESYTSGPHTEQTYTEPYDNAVTHATLELNAGASKCTLTGVTDSLVCAHTISRFGNFTFDADKHDSVEHVTLSMKNKRGWHFGFGSDGWNFGGKNLAELQLNTHPAWCMDLNLGAASIDMDLSPYIIQTAHLDCGAAKAKIKLGDRSDVTHLEISAGASSLELAIPSGSGCEITADGALLGKDFPGFTKNGEDKYYTDNYNTAQKKIFIALDAGASKISVSRY